MVDSPGIVCVEQTQKNTHGLEHRYCISAGSSELNTLIHTCAALGAVPSAGCKVEAMHIIQLMAGKAPNHEQ